MSKSKPIVLIVGANSETLELFSEVLKKEGYKVVTTQTSVSGLIKAQSGVFDSFILDLHLPDGSGIELCKEIRKFDKPTPILFYSADAQPKRIEDAMKAGAHAYLSQLKHPFVLLETVERLIGKSA